jgi:hypothetical protein
MEILKKWIDALRSGKYPQTTQVIEDSCGNCCLGVLLKVAGKDDIIKAHKIIKAQQTGELEDVEASDPIWAERISETLAREIGAGFLYDKMIYEGPNAGLQLVDALIDMNDSHDKSFIEIADYLEAQLK